MLDSGFLENFGGGGASGCSVSDGMAEELRNDGGSCGGDGECTLNSAGNGLVVELRNDGVSCGGDGEGDLNSAGNRWPHQETLALLKIRSDLDQVFRDSPVKAPLWDEVSRKLGELGYNRSAKKSQEKFENVYKYHRRIKQGNSNQQTGKSYKFFDQLEFFDTQFSAPSTPLDQIVSQSMKLTSIEVPNKVFMLPCSNQDRAVEFIDASRSTASSSGGSEKKMKTNLGDYFEKLKKEILLKQEDLQNKFLEALEKYEKDRIAREEAWKTQEMVRIKREQDFLAQERAMAVAKDAAMLAFLQKFSHEMPETLTRLFSENHLEKIFEKNISNSDKQNTCGTPSENTSRTSSSRWPKAEIEALIMLKIDLDLKYQEIGPKGPLWEDISVSMNKLGYHRSAKRCKEKWENINKYYKRIKDSNKRRPGNSRACPYFSMLESLYANKSKKLEHSNSHNDGGGCNLKPEQILMQMMLQQQPPPLQLSFNGEICSENQEDGADYDI